MYHNWLAATPKYHISSSVVDNKSTGKVGKPRCRPKHTVDNLATLPHRQPLQHGPPTQRSNQASMTPTPASYRPPQPVHTVMPPSAAFYLPITPPMDMLDDPSTDDDGMFYDSGFPEELTASLFDGFEIPQDPTVKDVRPEISRDHMATKPLRHQAATYHFSQSTTMLPSPPSSPTATLQTPPLPKSKITTTSSLTKEKVGKPANALPLESFPDPMMQTSTVPFYWGSDCTVLKADTSIQHGSVTSPTCMVGLPFGSMTEMSLPHPGSESRPRSGVNYAN
jgi:hypothetical protein